MHLSEEGTMEVVEVVLMEEKGGTFRHEEGKKEVDKPGRNLFQVIT